MDFPIQIDSIKMKLSLISLVQIRKFYERKSEIVFLPINLNMCLGAQKNSLNERVLLSTHNIFFR